jgi:hypothetical protein
VTDLKQIQPVRIKKLIKPKTTFILFFLLSAVAGVFSLIGILALPPSEAKNLVISDYSFRRLSFIGFHLLGIAIFFGLFLRACFSAGWAEKKNEKFKKWSQTNPFQSTAFFCLILGLVIGLSALDFLMDPARFPRMVLYMFLYIRMRPIALWLLAIVIQIFLLVLVHHWSTISLRDFFPQTRSAIFGFCGLMSVLVINIIIWQDFFRNPDNFLEKNPLVLGIVCFSLVLLFISLFSLSYQTKQKPK